MGTETVPLRSLEEELPALATPAQVSQVTGIATSTLSGWRFQLRGPAWVKIGNLVRYPREAVIDWIRQHLQGGEQG